MTKIFLAAILAVSAGAASAASNFSLIRAQDSNALLDLGTITADASGVVEVYDIQSGRLLGSEDLHAGVNNDVRVSLAAGPSETVLTVLKVGGQVMDQETIRIDENE